MDWPDHLPPQIHVESHFIVNLCPLFYMKVYLWHTEAFGKMLDGSHVSSLFLGNKRQHMPVGSKTISSWVSKVLGIAKAHLCWGNLQGVVVLAAIVTGVSLVSILEVGDWVEFMPARHYFLTYINTTDWHQDSMQYCVHGLNEQSACW